MASMNRDVAGAFGAVAIGVAGLALTQPSIASGLHAAKEREDVYLFPPPAQLRIGTLGYNAAAVDMLWVKLRVEYGMHFAEKRQFPDVTHYMDAILALEPDFFPLFKYADTMLCYHSGDATPDDARTARAYLERGIEARPDDHEVWLHYGQFLAFMSPTFLTAPAEIDAWRLRGAEALQRAVELGDDPDRSIAAATLLDQQNRRPVAIHALEQAYALADDETTRESIALKLSRLQAEDVGERMKRDFDFVDARWRSQWPFVKRGTALLFGPAPDPFLCAGPRGSRDSACAMDWEPVLPSSKQP
jgi:hypothetical protein